MMMILITLSLAAILVAWAGTTYGSFSGGSSLFFSQRGQALQERFVIEEVYFLCGTPPGSACSATPRTGYADIFVRNVGVEQIDIVAIYVNGASSGLSGVVLPCAISGNTVPVYVGTADPTNHPNVCEFQVTGLTWTTGAIFTIVVASLRGNQVISTTRGP
jgi:hypothetical protein